MDTRMRAVAVTRSWRPAPHAVGGRTSGAYGPVPAPSSGESVKSRPKGIRGRPLYPRFWFHVFEHIAVIPIASLATLGVMAIPYFLHRWPVTVAPATVLGGLVTLGFSAEAMNLAPTTASAWSSSVGLLLSGLYLGGIGPSMGLLSPRQLLAPALVLGWVWRLWNFLAALVSALLGHETHFFDPSQGRVAVRLLELLGGE